MSRNWHKPELAKSEWNAKDVWNYTYLWGNTPRILNTQFSRNRMKMSSWWGGTETFLVEALELVGSYNILDPKTNKMLSMCNTLVQIWKEMCQYWAYVINIIFISIDIIGIKSNLQAFIDYILEELPPLRFNLHKVSHHTSLCWEGAREWLE